MLKSVEERSTLANHTIHQLHRLSHIVQPSPKRHRCRTDTMVIKMTSLPILFLTWIPDCRLKRKSADHMGR